MDPYYPYNHHHQHQWHGGGGAPTPPPICPSCSLSHFPFCPSSPPLPPYNQNPNFPPDYPRPDPYLHPIPYPTHAYPYPPHPNPNINEVSRSHKRPRVDEDGFHNLPPPPPHRISLDDERRLKLIREHGNVNENSYIYNPFNPNNNDTVKINNNNNTLNDHHQSDELSLAPYESPRFVGYVAPPLPPGPGYDNSGFIGQPPPPPPPPPPPLPPPPETSFSLFPIPVSPRVANPYLRGNVGSVGAVSEEWVGISRQYVGEGQACLRKQLSPDKPTVVDASHLFNHPYRASRPDHFVIILRGLPGSGKSYLAKMMRDLEVENGGKAPRIHSMDDYFMTEVEKVEDADASKSSSSVRGKKPTMKKVMEYCYEPEMEEAYRDSMLKAFKKTLEEGIFTFVIVDDRNLRVAEFAQFWAIAKRSGYEAYISEAAYKDPVGCAARNVHGFTLDEIQMMVNQWEEAPSLYTHLNIKSLFRGDDLKENGIKEVDMDTEDDDLGDNAPVVPEEKPEKAFVAPTVADMPHEDGNRWGTEDDHHNGVKELGKSKWSEKLDEDDEQGSKAVRGNSNALSGLIQAYGKRGKSVHWSDQVGYSGFSIGAAKKASVRSLVMGAGAGYNLKSNPILEEESLTLSKSIGQTRNQSVFQERLRAEHESFKAVFEKRKQRIGGLALDEEY